MFLKSIKCLTESYSEYYQMSTHIMSSPLFSLRIHMQTEHGGLWFNLTIFYKSRNCTPC